ncbi:uncharacterized protein B0J16DRAFT_331875 [Fusarium flagelliforme]|uniref:Infection structure specific protein n=1 Tax=Fusarium flagelliforme TaxID=2675880 RepID=A0A395N4U4_9HYPO|nr:uncharacterized protein B0J16DRAFT_331875 [Fusarium flagelliforme]KAH7191867.1 hypothetical protein B0J16DRAFT_331875 [Fusarium flagelliforme]RFN55156.1 infection structure specific protein [Fusarium flagelliforme]
MQSIVIASLLATAVSANVNFMANPIMKRAALEPRQTGLPSLGDITPECQSAVLDLAQGIPTPAPEIVSDLLENPQTDPCDFSTPASLSAEYSSYSADIISWYGENSGDIMSAIKECPELAQFASMVPICTAVATEAASTKIASLSSAAGSAATAVVPPVVSTHGAEEHNTPVATPSAKPTSTSPAEIENGAASAKGGLLYVAAAAVAGVVAAL